MIFNFFVKSILKSPFHRLLSKGTILLNFIGRKSGKTYEVPVNFVMDNGVYLVTSLKSRTWWKNFRGKGRLSLLASGKSINCVAEVLETQEVVLPQLKHYLKLAPQVAKYFSVGTDENGDFLEDDLLTASAERIILRINPVN